jgi:hypothetical protein
MRFNLWRVQEFRKRREGCVCVCHRTLGQPWVSNLDGVFLSLFCKFEKKGMSSIFSPPFPQQTKFLSRGTHSKKMCRWGQTIRLIDLVFYVPLKNISLVWRRHHYRWRASKFGPLLAVLKSFEQRGIFIVPHLLCHWASVFPVSSEGPPHSVASYDTQVGVKNLF